METRLLAYEQAVTTTEIAAWANDLIGKEVPGSPGYKVVRIIQFQFVQKQDGYSALILVEVTEMTPEIAIKEADAIVIEQLTSTIDGPSENEATL